MVLPKFSIAQNVLSPDYLYFKIRKPKGGYREIEAPENHLKKVQRKLNEYLQYVYYTLKTDAAYGFIINPRHKKAKNIVTNAARHLHHKYLLNIDFEDFFHQISTEKVIEIFSKLPFHFQKYTIKTLAKICTNKGRLPMGAPTSPVLSNFACIEMDQELEQWCLLNQITYSRFVDDLSFSSDSHITETYFENIKNITQKHHLYIDPEKTKWFDDTKPKIVTGLYISDKVDIPPDFYKELDADLLRLKHVNEVHYLTGALHKADALKNFKQQVMGKINFIAVVHGYDHPHYTAFFQKYEQALQPPDEALTMRWTQFSNYQF